MKKWISLLLAAAMVMAMPVSALAAEPARNEYTITTGSGAQIDVAIPRELAGMVDKRDIAQLVEGENLKDGEKITIWDVGSGEESRVPGIQPQILYTYETDILPVGEEKPLASYFVTSVARGMTLTLTDEFKKTVGITITSGTPYDRGQIQGSVTAKYTTSYEFAGPPEGSPYNSREYRVQFYYRDAIWFQKKLDLSGKLLGSQKGQAKLPTKYLLYSVDHTIE